jgi:clan AA aspartic protease
MGYVWVDAIIKNPFTGKSISVKALVDTGATLTVISRKIANELGLPMIGKSLVQTARGVAELEACFGVVEIMGEETPARILVSDEVDTVLIGITVLEQLGLEVDPVTGKLKKTKLLLL